MSVDLDSALAQLRERCERFEPDALAQLNGYPADHPLVAEYLRRSFDRDRVAIGVLRRMHWDSPARHEWARLREPGLLEWRKLDGLAYGIIRKFIWREADALDVKQTLWFKFIESAADLRFRAEAGTRQRWIGQMAEAERTDYLLRLARRAEVPADGPAEPAARVTPSTGELSYLVTRAEQLILAGRIETPKAVAMLAAHTAGIGAIDMVRQYLDAPLRKLADQVIAAYRISHCHGSSRLIEFLEGEMRTPLGGQCLGQLVRQDSFREPPDVLQAWIDHALRLCRDGLPAAATPDQRELHARNAYEEFITQLASETRFLVSRLGESGREKRIIWGCLRVIRLDPSRLEPMLLPGSAIYLRDRLLLLLGLSENDHARMSEAAGTLPALVVIDYVRREGTSLNRIREAVDRQYQRSEGQR